MNYIKLFDSFGQSEATVEDVTDIFNNVSDNYDCDIKIRLDSSDRKYHNRNVFIIETLLNDRSLLEYDWNNEIGMMKSIWGLDLISKEKNYPRILFLFA